MGWRFRKSFKVLPGVRMNVGSKGVTSWSFGGRGARVNVGKRGVTTTYSLFGTGLSYRTFKPRARPTRVAAAVPSAPQTAPTTLTAPTSLKNRSLKSYALVGVAAVVGYGILKPEQPATQPSSPTYQASHRTPEERRPSLQSTPTAVSPAAAAVPRSQVPSRLEDMVTTTGANVRGTASMSGPVVRVLDAGTRVRLLGREGTWRRVGDPSGEVWGWVHSSILR